MYQDAYSSDDLRGQWQAFSCNGAGLFSGFSCAFYTGNSGQIFRYLVHHQKCARFWSAQLQLCLSFESSYGTQNLPCDFLDSKVSNVGYQAFSVISVRYERGYAFEAPYVSIVCNKNHAAVDHL